MGVLNGRDLFSKKYTTGIIVDQNNEGFIMPLKYGIGDYFLAVCNDQLYAFRFKGSRLITTKQKFARAFSYYIYFTDHYDPVSPSHVKELENVLTKNNLPRMNYKLFAVFKNLSKKEKTPKEGETFTPHKLASLVQEIGEQEEKYPEQVKNLKAFFSTLGTEEIVTPIKRITEFVEDDLIATDPKFLGDLVTIHSAADKENKIMSNKVQKPKRSLLMIFLIIGLIAGLGILGVWAISSGAFSGIGSQFGSFGGTPPATVNDMASKYPTPEAAKHAIDTGEAKLSDFPKAMQDYIKNYKPPVTVQPSK